MQQALHGEAVSPCNAATPPVTKRLAKTRYQTPIAHCLLWANAAGENHGRVPSLSRTAYARQTFLCADFTACTNYKSERNDGNPLC